MAYAAPPTSLHGVALAGEDEEIRTLVSRGVPLHRQDAGGWTALHYAAAADRHSTTSVLLQLGADPSVSTAAVPTLTPLHLAVSCRGGEDTLRRLIEHRAPLDARDELGQTALHLAVSMRDVSAVRILLEAVRCPFALAPPHCSTSPSPRPHLALTSPSPHPYPTHRPLPLLHRERRRPCSTSIIALLLSGRGWRAGTRQRACCTRRQDATRHGRMTAACRHRRPRPRPRRSPRSKPRGAPPRRLPLRSSLSTVSPRPPCRSCSSQAPQPPALARGRIPPSCTSTPTRPERRHPRRPRRHRPGRRSPGRHRLGRRRPGRRRPLAPRHPNARLTTVPPVWARRWLRKPAPALPHHSAPRALVSRREAAATRRRHFPSSCLQMIVHPPFSAASFPLPPPTSPPPLTSLHRRRRRRRRRRRHRRHHHRRQRR